MENKNFLLQKYGPYLSLEQLAGLLNRKVGGLRNSLRGRGEVAAKFNPTKKKLGRRVYFITQKVAAVLDEEDA